MDDIEPRVWTMGLTCAYLVPPVGLVIGLMNLERRGGTTLVGASLIAGVFWVVLGAMLAAALA